MAHRVSIEQRGSVEDIKKDIAKNIEYLQTSMEVFSRKTAEYMSRVIRDNTRRKPATGRLAKAIKHYVDWGGGISTTGGTAVFGVGRKPDLPRYWALVNYGGLVPNRGKFVRGSFNGEGPDLMYAGVPGGAGVRFGKDNRRKIGMRAKSVVHPMNYIEKTQSWFATEWPGYIRSKMAKRNR